MYLLFCRWTSLLLGKGRGEREQINEDGDALDDGVGDCCLLSKAHQFVGQEADTKALSKVL